MIGVILAEGHEEIESITIVDILRRAGLNIAMYSIIDDLDVKGAHEIIIRADYYLKDLKDKTLEGIILPGGMPGAINIMENNELKEIVIKMNEDKKLIGAICAAPIALGEWGILTDKKAICYPGFEKKLIGAKIQKTKVTIDENIVTAEGPASAFDFALKIVSKIKGNDATRTLKQDMLIED